MSAAAAPLALPPPPPGAFRYAVIDLAAVPALRPAVPRLLSSVAEPLLARNLPHELLSVAPWLVDLAQAPDVAETLASIGPRLPWGYYLISRVDLVSLRQALRKFNLAKLPDRKREVIFRYWDPRVLPTFLDHGTAAQRMRFLEWIDRVEFADGATRERRDGGEG